MFEAGKELKCSANDARISVENWKKKNLNDFIRKLDKTKGLQPGSPERSAQDLLVTDQKDLIRRQLTSGWREFRWSFALNENILNIGCNKTALCYLCQNISSICHISSSR